MEWNLIQDPCFVIVRSSKFRQLHFSILRAFHARAVEIIG